MIVPAVLSACERHNPDGRSALLGIAVGTEIMCRLSLVAPTKTHKAGFHPTAIFGAMGAAAGVAVALKLDKRKIVDALGVAGSMASGIIEYLAEGTWTKRMHAVIGPAGRYCRARRLLRPRTVFEGVHGLFTASPTTSGDLTRSGDFAKRWVTETWPSSLTPCGTMTHLTSIAHAGLANAASS